MYILYEKQNNRIDNESIVIAKTEKAIRKSYKELIKMYTSPDFKGIIKQEKENSCIIMWEETKECFEIVIEKIIENF